MTVKLIDIITIRLITDLRYSISKDYFDRVYKYNRFPRHKTSDITIIESLRQIITHLIIFYNFNYINHIYLF